MPGNEKGQAEARPIPNAVVYHDSAESKASFDSLQGLSLARFVFGPAVAVACAPIVRNARLREPWKSVV